MKRNTFYKIAATVLIFSIFPACSNASGNERKKFGHDENYYLGLKSLADGNKKAARIKLKKSAKKGSSLVSRRSFEALCTLGDAREKVESAKKMLLQFDDEASRLTACRTFFDCSEIGLVLNTTSNLNVQEADNELVSLRLRSMSKRNISKLTENTLTWFLNRPLSSFHKEIYEEDFDSWVDESEYRNEKLLISFRMNVYKKNYPAAFEQFSEVWDFLETDKSFLTDQMISDIGKTHLYAGMNLLESANWFKSVAESFKEQPSEFYWWFYAGRLFDKEKNHNSKALECFKKAFDSTDDKSKKDNALWYYLRGSLKSSLKECIKITKENIRHISDAEYYDDYFDMLSSVLLSNGYYREIGEIYKLMEGYASKEATAKFAYIYARILQENIFVPDEIMLKGKTSDEEISDALKISLNSATDIYYKIMAAEKLGLSDYEKEKCFTAPRKSLKAEINPDAERLLSGYAVYGFPEKIYSEWVKLGQCFLSEETTISLCRLLQKCSDGKDDYYPQSLRIASKYANYSNLGVSREILLYCFPKCYEKFVISSAEKYGIESDVLFALIRSESFFDSDVVSSAGAIGLCQLMKFTADDVAYRLKKTDYDLLDPETNIEFGTWYLGNLISRLEGNYLDAFFSYNAGITRVRKWKQSSAFGFGRIEIPDDLFLETLPFTETREYGRKLVSATEMYRWLDSH